MRRWLFGILFGLWAAPVFAQCPGELAVYKMPEAKGFSIRFSKQKHPKAWSNIQATLTTPTREFDFEFTASNGYSLNYMVILTKGIKIDQDLPILLLDKNLKALGLPEVGQTAPEYLIASALGPWLYYAGFEHQEYIPSGVWKLTSCHR